LEVVYKYDPYYGYIHQTLSSILLGPNTEIFYDRGEAYGQNDPAEEMYPGGENERYLDLIMVIFTKH
jgi:hypothetical protein